MVRPRAELNSNTHQAYGFAYDKTASGGRFTQVDPFGMRSTSLDLPQTLNLYAYCTNDPINQTDPDGLGFFSFFKKLFKGIGKVFSAVGNAISRVLNNRWVRIGIFIASFLIGIPGVVAFLGKAVTAAIQTALNIYNTVADIASSLQLAGLLYQGKFKALAVTLGLGLASAAISVVADHVIESVKARLKGGFTFKGLFQGAWSGLKDGFADVFGRGWESLIPVYGKYCGPGASRGGGIDKGNPIGGIHGIDKLCQTHDIDYKSDINGVRLDADKALFRGLFTARSIVQIGDIAFAGRPSGGNVYRFLAFPAFGGLIVYRKFR